MTDEELITRLRDFGTRPAWLAADRIEALVKERGYALHRIMELDDRAERLEARLAAAVGVLEFYARSERDDAGLLAETVLAKIKGADHD